MIVEIVFPFLGVFLHLQICFWVPQHFMLFFPNVWQNENRFCVSHRFTGETTSSWVLLLISFLATLGPKCPWDTIFF